MTGLVICARVTFVVLALLIGWVSLTPDPEQLESGFVLARMIADMLFLDSSLADKVAHFGAYGALGAFAFWARWLPLKIRWTTPIGLAAYGALLEVLQGLGGIRDMELADAIANAMGAVLGYFVAALLAQLRSRLS